MIALYAEDNDDDAELVKLAFEEAGFSADLHRVKNGEECLRFLRREPPYQSAPAPDLVFLDINMPVLDGHQVMEEILADDQLKHQPVVVLSTSSAPEDINRMYRNRCNVYAVKPATFKEFVTLVEKVMTHWTAVAVPLNP